MHDEAVPGSANWELSRMGKVRKGTEIMGAMAKETNIKVEEHRRKIIQQ